MPRGGKLSKSLWYIVLLGLSACGGPKAEPSPPPPQPFATLFTPALAGQTVLVLPATLVLTDPRLPAEASLADRPQTLHWADSLLAAALVSRAPEVTWKLPDELRKIARRAPGIVVDPDHMGQSVLRLSALKEVPDPLRTSLRTLAAMAGGRHALVPSAVSVGPTETGQVRAEVSLVLADARTGRIAWRSLSPGEGASPTEALGAALAKIFPLEGGP